MNRTLEKSRKAFKSIQSHSDIVAENFTGSNLYSVDNQLTQLRYLNSALLSSSIKYGLCLYVNNKAVIKIK